MDSCTSQQKHKWVYLGPSPHVSVMLFYFDVFTISTCKVVRIIRVNSGSSRISGHSPLHGVWRTWFALRSKQAVYLNKALMMGYLLLNCIIEGYFMYYCPPTATFDWMLPWFDHILLKRNKWQFLYSMHHSAFIACIFNAVNPDTLQSVRICKKTCLHNVLSPEFNLCYKTSHHRKHTLRLSSLKVTPLL